jgi:hypothetical protein
MFVAVPVGEVHRMEVSNLVWSQIINIPTKSSVIFFYKSAMIHMVALQILRFSEKFNIANSLLFWYSDSAFADVITVCMGFSSK